MTKATPPVTSAQPAATPKRRRRRSRPEPAVPLGSLTQVSSRAAARCVACESPRITVLDLVLTDGTPVRFMSCHACEHRRWEHSGTELSRQDVLAKTQTA